MFRFSPPTADSYDPSATAVARFPAGTSGPVILFEGGSNYNVQVDAGLLTFSGTNQYLGSLNGSRTYNFSGAGDAIVSGPILNATNAANICVIGPRNDRHVTLRISAAAPAPGSRVYRAVAPTATRADGLDRDRGNIVGTSPIPRSGQNHGKILQLRPQYPTGIRAGINDQWTQHTTNA